MEILLLVLLFIYFVADVLYGWGVPRWATVASFLLLISFIEIWGRMLEKPRVYFQNSEGMFLHENKVVGTKNIDEALSIFYYNPLRGYYLDMAEDRWGDMGWEAKKIHYLKANIGSNIVNKMINVLKGKKDV